MVVLKNQSNAFGRSSYRKRSRSKSKKPLRVTIAKKPRKKSTYNKVVGDTFVAKQTKITVASGQSLANLDGGIVITPSLSLMASAELAAYTTLYDEFRIVWVQYQMKSTNQSTILPFMFYSVLDFTDAASLTGIDDALEYDNCKKCISTARYPVNRRWYAKLPELTHDINHNPVCVSHPFPWMQLAPRTIGGADLLFDNTIAAIPACKVCSDTNDAAAGAEFEVYITMKVLFRGRH